ncbi:MAG: prepilin-type N-terminal cleavage/methylation domain-containing protein [Gammaproteobacteria bacterium]|nr:prepilin-type N-terminal cleavage/methylation domain-containing protein [Gammaproteobacteria bacterium]
MNKIKLNKGFSLVELVISIVIISVALTGVLMIMNRTAVSSADPMIRTQVTAIAQSYLEEIMLRNYSDPDGSEVGENRSTYDDVDDYHNLANNGCLTATAACPMGSCACDQNGNPIEQLKNYAVQVTVIVDNMNFSVPTSVPARRIDITVSHSSGISTSLTSYRADR